MLGQKLQKPKPLQPLHFLHPCIIFRVEHFRSDTGVKVSIVLRMLNAVCECIYVSVVA